MCPVHHFQPNLAILILKQGICSSVSIQKIICVLLELASQLSLEKESVTMTTDLIISVDSYQHGFLLLILVTNNILSQQNSPSGSQAICLADKKKTCSNFIVSLNTFFALHHFVHLSCLLLQKSN